MRITSIGGRRSLWAGCLVCGVLCVAPAALARQVQPRLSSAPRSDTGGRVEAETAEEADVEKPAVPARKPQTNSFQRVAVPALRGTSTDQETPAVDEDHAPSASPAAASRFKRVAPKAEEDEFEPVVLDVEAARFKDVQPGVTTQQQLESSWGPPIEVQPKGDLVRYVYQIEGFKQITITLRQGKVSSIVIDLAESYAADELVRELGLADQRWVIVRDNLGNALGQSQPERGVLLSFNPDDDAPHVDQLIVEEIDAQPFIQRAATSLEERCRDTLADVDYALTLAPGDAKAHWLRAEVLLRFGRRWQALEAADTAVRLAPDEPEYHLTRGRILGELGLYVRAVADTTQAIDLGRSRGEVMASGLVQLGDQIAAGPDRDYKAAIEYHLEAIRVAEPLKNDRRPEVRRVARRAMVDAHLAAAGDIAWGAWKRKSAVVPKWIQRAEEIAAQTFERGNGDDELLLAVARGALAADVGLGGALDPSDWVARLIERGSRRIEQTADPVARRHRQWVFGMALYDALQAAHMRDEPEQALQYGMLAAEYLEYGSAIGRELPGYSYVMGRLYFRVGSIHAVHHGDHLRAVKWFDKAAPLMEKPIPVSSLADTGRQGETFVSMAVSYWDVGQSDESVRLTSLGVELMENAVEEGILEPLALAVPYHNLARIHRRLGNDQKAGEYQRLAARHEPTERR